MGYRYLTFNPHRAIGIPKVKYLKPENMYQSTKEIYTAQKLLFPESWQVNTLIYGFKKRIFPSPSTYHLGYDKIEMTRAMKACFPNCIPKTEILSSATADFDNLADQFGLPFVCKEVRNASGFGVFLIHTKEDFMMFTRNNRIVYVQEYLKINKDLRVVIIGDTVIDYYWRIKAPGCFHSNLSRGACISRKNIPREVINEVVRIALFLKIDYAGFDIALTEEGLKLFEFNIYFGTKGIRLSSFELGQKINDYLKRKSGKIDLIPRDIHYGRCREAH